MGMPAKDSVQYQDFPGLSANGDDIDLPPGQAKEQTNATSIGPGKLEVRRGYRQIQFENGD